MVRHYAMTMPIPFFTKWQGFRDRQQVEVSVPTTGLPSHQTGPIAPPIPTIPFTSTARLALPHPSLALPVARLVPSPRAACR